MSQLPANQMITVAAGHLADMIGLETVADAGVGLLWMYVRTVRAYSSTDLAGVERVTVNIHDPVVGEDWLCYFYLGLPPELLAAFIANALQ